MGLDPETEFFRGLIELQYGKKVEKKLEKISGKVSWAKGWPKRDEAFWNAEAFMWQRKISPEKRALIGKELKFLSGGKLSGGKNLDLGCGAYSYIPSVGLDFSEKMLQFNHNCDEKVKGDLEKRLPWGDQQFDSVTAVFVLNYVKNYGLLLNEVKRVLKGKGILMMVLSGLEINPWQRQKELNPFSGREWKEILEENGFKVKFYEREGVWFFRCGLR